MIWFKHDTNAITDAKIKKLLIKHGAVGYAVYFHCLELIAGDISDTNMTFELEHDSEIIADDLRITGSGSKSGIDIVEDIMMTIIDLQLFEYSGERITCFKLLKRLDSSMTSNTKMRGMIAKAKSSLTPDNHDGVMMHHDGVMTRHDTIMQEEKRREENRIEKTREEDMIERNDVSPTLQNVPQVRDEGLDKNAYTEKEPYEHNQNKTKDTKQDTTPYKEIIDYLNLKTGKSFRHTTRSTKELIQARYKEGFTLDDFKKVIDNKTIQWKDDEKFDQYLRPQTLFTGNFDSYLNTRVQNKPLAPKRKILT